MKLKGFYNDKNEFSLIFWNVKNLNVPYTSSKVLEMKEISPVQPRCKNSYSKVHPKQLYTLIYDCPHLHTTQLRWSNEKEEG